MKFTVTKTITRTATIEIEALDQETLESRLDSEDIFKDADFKDDTIYDIDEKVA